MIGQVRNESHDVIVLTHLRRPIEVFGAVTVNIVVRTDGLLEFVADDQSWSFGRRTTREEHDACASVGEGRLKQAYSDADSNTRATKRTLVVRNRPGVAREGLQDARQLEFALLDRHQEAGGTECLRRHGLARPRRSTVLGAETEHVLDLLGGVLLPSAEDIRLAALSITQLVHLGLSHRYQYVQDAPNTSTIRTIVPNVIKPTRA